MSHRLPPQPDCAAAWLAAARYVDNQPGREADNVMIDVTCPVVGASLDDPIVSAVDSLIGRRDKSVIAIANTIFPNALYQQYGAWEFIDKFRDNVLPKVRKNYRWSGYYFERMIDYPTPDGRSINQIRGVIERIRNPKNKSLHKFQISLFDPALDTDNSPYGGQCLSFMAFNLSRKNKSLSLTAVYRNHYYIEKLLGNLIGLGWLTAFMAKESGVRVGKLTLLSVHAEIDQPRETTRDDVRSLLQTCEENRRVASCC